MSAPHNATPEHWARIERWTSGNSACSCILELRDRIEALEAANSQPIPNDRQIRSSAPAGGLVQSVGAAICTIDDCGSTPSNWAPEARAAILAVAEHIRQIGCLNSNAIAQWLEMEVERHD